MHCAARVRSSGGWIEAAVIVEMLDDAGYDRAWARCIHALAQLPRHAVQVLGVNMTNAEDGPAAEPAYWDKSFGRKSPAFDYVDRGAPMVTPKTRVPLLFR
eukprot:1409053-Pyramimonas_sp.AAC.1